MIGKTTAGKLLKGLYAAGVSALGSLSTVLVGNKSLADVTSGQWVTIALAALVSFGGVYGLAAWSGPSTKGGG